MSPSVDRIKPRFHFGIRSGFGSVARLICVWVLVMVGGFGAAPLAAQSSRPNVLFIAVDDLNDWAQPFGGHPKAITPHLDKLANQGAMVFLNAHCPGPVCGPSRSALLSGFMPHRTGIYGNSNNMLRSAMVQTHATLPEYFSKQGYYTLSRGKISHRHATDRGSDSGHWMYDQWVRSANGSGVDRKSVTSRDKNLIQGKPGPESKLTKRSGSEFAWGVTRGSVEQTKDFQTASWAADQLSKSFEKPFFMAVGFSKPHLPFYSPQEFWDLYPADQDYLPEINQDDFDDIRLPNGKPAGKKSFDFLWLEENGLQNEAARAYLACCSYADHCVGEVLDALDKSGHADNTIVVVWGDHGWHLGEKLRYRKAELWSESTRCPLMVKLPDSKQKQVCHRPVNLIDLYPTLIDLCGLPEKFELDGTSFVPLLHDPKLDWNPTITIRGPRNVSVHDEQWNLIHRANGVRELYNLKDDPMEWTNLYGKPDVASIQKQLESSVPKSFATPIEKSEGKKKANRLDPTIRPRRQSVNLK